MQLDEGLLRAVIESPDDDLPRLIAADWLDEHGEHERAEFIRASIRASQIVKGEKYTAEYNELAQRIHQLTPYRFWQMPNPSPLRTALLFDPDRLPSVDDMPTVATFDCRYRRGFIESITCTWSDWLTHDATIRAATPLKKVTLTTMPPTGSFLGLPESVSLIDFPHHGTYEYNEPERRLCERQWPGIDFELSQPTVRYGNYHPR